MGSPSDAGCSCKLHLEEPKYCLIHIDDGRSPDVTLYLNLHVRPDYSGPSYGCAQHPGLLYALRMFMGLWKITCVGERLRGGM
jgi:hypothetical protein